MVVVTNLFPTPLSPSMGSYNFEQIKALADYYEQIHVVVPIPFQQFGRKETKIFLDGKVLAYYVPYYYSPGIFRGWYARFYGISIRSTLKNIIQKFPVNHIYSTWLYPDSIAALGIARKYHFPIVAKAHGSDVNYLPSYSSIRNHYRKKLPLFDGIICVSQDLGKKISELAPVDAGKIHVVYNGVDLERFTIIDREEARRLLKLPNDKWISCYVGNLKISKGILDYLHFLELAGPEVYGCVVGDGPDKKIFIQKARERNLLPRLFMVGSQPHEKIPWYLNAADVTVLLSKNEGIPNILLESFACGTPAITVPVGGIPEILKEKINGLWFSSFQEAPRLGNFLPVFDREKIRRSIAHLNWHTNAEKVYEIFERIFAYRENGLPI